jgi:alkylated DNA repair dioxygenase AlkB
MSLDLTWQPSLLDAGDEPAVDEAFSGAERTWVDRKSWIERVPGWVSNSDALFAHLVETADWGQRTRKMWDNEVLEPRLTSWWGAESGKPLEPPILERMRRALSGRYGVEFDSMGLNLYRDGRDSVAWHGDRIANGASQRPAGPPHSKASGPQSLRCSSEMAEPLVAIVSVGEPRKFLLRPKARGTGLPTHRLLLGRGELLVTGGATQRAWEHSVPKVASAGPRLSLTFRHGLLRVSAIS